MQRKINQGGVVRKELWTTKRDDMGPLKRQHGHSSTRYNDAILFPQLEIS